MPMPVLLVTFFWTTDETPDRAVGGTGYKWRQSRTVTVATPASRPRRTSRWRTRGSGTAIRDGGSREFSAGADPNTEDQILPLVAEHVRGARRLLDIGCGEGQVRPASGERRR